MTRIRQNREEEEYSADKKNSNNNQNDYEMSATDTYAYADDDPMAGEQSPSNGDYVTEEGMQADANADFFDDDDYYDDDEKIKEAKRRQSRRKFDDEDDDSYEDGSGGKFANDDDDSGDDDDFFATKRKTNKGRYNNDAIKIISTPLGKVGIVYEQPRTPSTSSQSKSTPTDFDSLSPASVSGRHSTHPKITPVLTADGKVALLYRGDSESSKYEPIKNFTDTFNFYDNKTKVDSKINKYGDSEEDMGWDEDDDGEDIPSSSSSSEINKKVVEEQSTNNLDIEQSLTETPELPSKSESGFDNSVLPMINKPLSEVLGIKKNQFTQFRIKDDEPVTTPASILPPFIFSTGGESKSINHENPSINLGSLPNSRAAADFDFGRDATMLDTKLNTVVSENEDQGHQIIEEDATIAASDVLAKTEVVNLAIIPHFDEEFEKQQHGREHELRRLHHRQRHRYRHINEDISNIHCIMQAMMGVAAVSTVFGMLGAMFKQKIIDAIRSLHW